VSGGVHNRRRAAFADPNERRTFESDRIHDGLDLIGTFLDRPHLRNRVGQAHPGLVIDHHASKGREVFEERGELWGRPTDLDIRDERPSDDDVDVSGAEHLVGEAQVTTARVPCLGHSSRLRPKFAVCAGSA
jgi:hypothetical protein